MYGELYTHYTIMNTIKIPLHSYDLLDELNKAYPEKCPSPSMPEREIWMYAGKRELINNLLTRREKEERSSLYPPTFNIS